MAAIAVVVVAVHGFKGFQSPVTMVVAACRGGQSHPSGPRNPESAIGTKGLV